MPGRMKNKLVYGWFMSMYGKTHYNIVKKLASDQNKLIN